jgi:hypothetical protein
MASEAVFGFIGVILGSASTALLTVYRERLVTRREREAREHQREQDRKDQHDTFQRESLLTLQDAVSDLIKAVYTELDRMLKELQQTSKWPARQWETLTATGWEDAELRLQVSCARVFDEEIRSLSRGILGVAMKIIWAGSLDDAKHLNAQLDQLHERFNGLVANAFPRLY